MLRGDLSVRGPQPDQRPDQWPQSKKEELTAGRWGQGSRMEVWERLGDQQDPLQPVTGPWSLLQFVFCLIP